MSFRGLWLEIYGVECERCLTPKRDTKRQLRAGLRDLQWTSTYPLHQLRIPVPLLVSSQRGDRWSAVPMRQHCGHVRGIDRPRTLRFQRNGGESHEFESFALTFR